MVDLHAHILPGLDDGPTDMTEAVAMCRLAAEDGTTTMVATPHMLGGLYTVTREAVLRGVQRLRKRLGAEGVPLKVEPGADVHLEPDVCELLQRGRLVTVGDRGRYLMLELPQAVIPDRLSELRFSMQVAGLTPIISHPERNFEVQANPDVMRPFVESGTILQLTAASVVGDLGRRAERCAHQLLRARLAHVVASDAHSLRNRPPGLSRARAVVERVLSADEADEMFDRRPERILAGEYLDVPEPVTLRLSRRERWFSWRR